tara:strand:+ start:31 stop:1356 length:1326 start_codon:yes stop_codon:yes gene_type:complete
MKTIKYPAKITKNYILKLSIPIFFSNLAIPLVGVVDTGLMGNLGSEKFLAATSIATSVITMIFWSFGFLRMGTTGLIAQALGKGDYREIVLTTLRNIAIATVIALILILLKDKILQFIDNFFQYSNETKILIESYISIRIFSAPAELIIYVLIGLYLGMQKTIISSLIVSFFSILNILLSAYLVLFLELNIYGVALGTVLSAYITVIISLIFSYFYIQRTFNIIPRFRKIFITKKIINLFNINIDIFIRTILLTFAFSWITYQSSLLGEDYVAVNSILMQFIIVSAFFLDAYAFSTEGVIGFSLGRKVKKSFLFAVTNSFQLSFVTALFISILYLFFFKSLVNLFTDLEYLRYLSYGFMFWIILIPPVASFCYQYDGIFIGASQTDAMRNSMILSVTLFIIFSLIFVKLLHNHGLWLSLLIFMVLRSLSLRFYFSRILKKF